MTNPTGTRYPPETRWVWVQIQISTHGYEYGYEFLPVTYLLTASNCSTRPDLGYERLCKRCSSDLIIEE
jgi:hypothetical protein